jgi:hypothetical protein
MRQTIVLFGLMMLAACGKADTSAGAGSSARSEAVYADRMAVMPAKLAPSPPPQADALDTAADPLSAAVDASGPSAASKAIAVSVPQIAYTYSLTFRLAADEIARVQQAHVALCDKLGIARCHIVTMTQSGGEHGDASGNLVLMVDARAARAFGNQLVDVATKAGGDTVDRGIEAEDLSKQIVETEARIRAKQALADRLLEVLRTHKGGVADLVNAERALADVQEEIDTAKSELADAQGRVQLSTYKIDYAAETHFDSRAAGPLGSAWSQLGNVFGASLATLILLVGALLPWLLVAVPLGMGIRYGLRRRKQRREAEEAGE